MVFTGACSTLSTVPSDSTDASKIEAAAQQEQADVAIDEVAEEIVKSLALIDQATSCSLSFQTSREPQYTVFKLSDPHRIIVDLPEFSISDQADLSIAENDFISSVTAEKILDRDRDYLRITIALQDDFSYTTTSDASALNIEITHKTVPETGFPIVQDKPDASAQQAVAIEQGSTVISSIIPRATADGTSVEIASAAPIGKYRAYTLTQPNRLVIDMPGSQSSLNTKRIPVNDAFVDQVRIGTGPRNLRVVLDLTTEKMPQYQIAKQGTSLMIHLNADTGAPPDVAYADVRPGAIEESAGVIAEEPVDAALETTAETFDDGLDEEMKAFSGPKISFDFKDADIKNVLRLIADISGKNMIISDSVTGRITLKLDNIPLDEALELILETNNLGSIVTKNITRIETRERIKSINEEKLLARKSHEEVVDLEIKTFDVSYSKASDVAAFIKQLKVLSDRGSVTAFKLTNKVTVKDIPDNIPKIAELIREQDIPTRQVMIEARIVQSNPSFTKELGIRWGGTYSTTKDGDPITIGGGTAGDYIVNLPAAAGPGSGGAINLGYIKDNLTLNLQLSALENDDKIKIVSNPRVIGLDNQEARIKQGVALPYLTLNENGVTSTEFKDAVLELEVTPKITPADTVAIEVKVTKNQKSSQTGQDGEPGIDIRELETFLLIESGVTAVIGGIYETTHTINIKTVPFFGTLPYLGYLFKNKREEEQLTELLIFLTVTVLDSPENIAQDMEAVAG